MAFPTPPLKWALQHYGPPDLKSWWMKYAAANVLPAKVTDAGLAFVTVIEEWRKGGYRAD